MAFIMAPQASCGGSPAIACPNSGHTPQGAEVSHHPGNVQVQIILHLSCINNRETFDPEWQRRLQVFTAGPSQP